MQIGQNGTSLELQLAGYQFPDVEPGQNPLDDRSWDSNWLICTGQARMADGLSWSFREPVLTTWEVAELASWTQRVVKGATPTLASIQEPDAVTHEPARFYSRDFTGWLTFTEPHLSFAVRDYGESQIKLLVGLSHALAAPPIDPMKPKRSQFTVVTDKRQLEEAAEALGGQLATYPAR